MYKYSHDQLTKPYIVKSQTVQKKHLLASKKQNQNQFMSNSIKTIKNEKP